MQEKQPKIVFRIGHGYLQGNFRVALLTEGTSVWAVGEWAWSGHCSLAGETDLTRTVLEWSQFGRRLGILLPSLGNQVHDVLLCRDCCDRVRCLDIEIPHLSTISTRMCTLSTPPQRGRLFGISSRNCATLVLITTQSSNPLTRRRPASSQTETSSLFAPNVSVA